MGGVDDGSDSFAIILGHYYGKTAINVKTFKSINKIVLEKTSTIVSPNINGIKNYYNYTNNQNSFKIQSSN
jgi:hypothetical protein